MPMTNRERVLATYRHHPVDRVPDWEFGAWQQTIDRWHQEGLPEEITGTWEAINEYFRTDELEHGISPRVNVGLLPEFEYQVLEEKGDHLIVQDGDGAIAEMIRPELGASIPRYLRHALQTKADWEMIREERLNPDTPGRVPEDLDDLCRQSFDAQFPVTTTAGSTYGWIRNWMGVETVSYAVAEDPEWVGEMIERLTDLKLKLLERLAGKCRIDQCHWWEDMCFNKGPLVSPAFFAKYLVPQYRRVTDFLRRECGCEFNVLDCDGNIHQLVGLWLEGGINVMFPVEAAHTDGYRIKREFGEQVAMRGYFDKRALIAGKAAIDRELERIAPLLKLGGFVPHTDHLVPPDVSWEDYCYYRERKLALIGKE